MTLYQVLLFAHVLAAVVWLGGAVPMLLLWLRAVRSGDEQAIATQAGTSLWIEQRVALPAAAVVLLAGGWLMTEGNWGMEEGWLHIGMGAVFGAAGISVVWTGRFQRRLRNGDAAAQTLSGRITLGMLASTAVVLVALWAMIVKPWS
jgi:uncharacterized membrane protein